MLRLTKIKLLSFSWFFSFSLIKMIMICNVICRNKSIRADHDFLPFSLNSSPWFLLSLLYRSFGFCLWFWFYLVFWFFYIFLRKGKSFSFDEMILSQSLNLYVEIVHQAANQNLNKPAQMTC